MQNQTVLYGRGTRTREAMTGGAIKGREPVDPEGRRSLRSERQSCGADPLLVPLPGLLRCEHHVVLQGVRLPLNERVLDRLPERSSQEPRVGQKLKQLRVGGVG